MKKFYHRAAILVILALVAIPLTGCVKVVYSTASLSEATICKSVNLTTMAPIERADVFPPDFDIIYCSVKLSNAPSNTQVKVQWFDNNNQQLLEKTITADGTRYISSSITRATAAPFTTGSYAVKLFLNGREQVTVPFTLQASTAASLSEATMCKSVDSLKRPIDKTDVFAPDTPEIFCSIKVSNAPPDTKIKAEWIYIQGEAEGLKNYSMESWSTETEGTRYIYASITRPDKGWPNGDYKVVWYIDGTEQMTVPFKVQDSTSATVQPSGVPLANIFQEPGFGYTIRYPADWEYQIQEDGYIVIFVNKKGEETSGEVVIQNLLSTKKGGNYEDADAVMNWMINGIKAADANAQISDVGAGSVPTEDGQQVIGKYCAIGYTYQGQKYVRLVMVVPHGQTFHLLHYESLADVFTANRPTVQAILASWTLTK
jgi:hypothetical protein